MPTGGDAPFPNVDQAVQEGSGRKDGRRARKNTPILANHPRHTAIFYLKAVRRGRNDGEIRLISNR